MSCTGTPSTSINSSTGSTGCQPNPALAGLYSNTYCSGDGSVSLTYSNSACSGTPEGNITTPNDQCNSPLNTFSYKVDCVGVAPSPTTNPNDQCVAYGLGTNSSVMTTCKIDPVSTTSAPNGKCVNPTGESYSYMITCSTSGATIVGFSALTTIIILFGLLY